MASVNIDAYYFKMIILKKHLTKFFNIILTRFLPRNIILRDIIKYFCHFKRNIIFHPVAEIPRLGDVVADSENIQTRFHPFFFSQCCELSY